MIGFCGRRNIIILQAAVLMAACSALPPPDPVRVSEARELVDAGVAELRQGKVDQAKAAFAMAADLVPLPEAIDGLGCAALRGGDLRSAQAYFLAAYEQDNEYAPALAHLAFLYETQGYTKEAERLYASALAADPRLFRDRNNFTAFLYDNGKADRAAARHELLKARAIVPHPVIEENLNVLDGANHGQN